LVASPPFTYPPVPQATTTPTTTTAAIAARTGRADGPLGEKAARTRASLTRATRQRWQRRSRRSRGRRGGLARLKLLDVVLRDRHGAVVGEPADELLVPLDREPTIAREARRVRDLELPAGVGGLDPGEALEGREALRVGLPPLRLEPVGRRVLEPGVRELVGS